MYIYIPRPRKMTWLAKVTHLVTDEDLEFRSSES